MTGAASLAKVLYLTITGIVLAAHSGHIRAYGQPVVDGPVKPAEIRSAYRERPSGNWSAVGHVVTARGADGRTRGETLRRFWRFETQCGGKHCQAYMARTAEGGRIQRSVLGVHPGYYSAAFPGLASDCEISLGMDEAFTGYFTIQWSKDGETLTAEEDGGFISAGLCGAAEEKILWRAHRVLGGRSEGTGQVL